MGASNFALHNNINKHYELGMKEEYDKSKVNDQHLTDQHLTLSKVQFTGKPGAPRIQKASDQK